MSDFDAFESAAPAAQEEDPAAAFLAGEQDKLAQLEDDNFGVESTGEQNAFGGDALFDAPPVSTETFEPAESAGNDLFDPLSAPANDEMTFEPAAEEPQPDSYSAISQVDKQRQVPEKIRVWQAEQLKQLEEKDAESEEKKREWREVAKKELEDWYRHRAEQLEKTKVTNRETNAILLREAEEAFVKERDEKVPGHEWERICRLCEFNPKGQRNSKDVSRMRSILLQLKQTPLVR